MRFRGVLDSLKYSFVDSSSVCFGDTPFTVVIGDKGDVVMRQLEEDKIGNYNIVTYLLRDRRDKHSKKHFFTTK